MHGSYITRPAANVYVYTYVHMHVHVRARYPIVYYIHVRTCSLNLFYIVYIHYNIFAYLHGIRTHR